MSKNYSKVRDKLAPEGAMTHLEKAKEFLDTFQFKYEEDIWLNKYIIIKIETGLDRGEEITFNMDGSVRERNHKSYYYSYVG